MTEQLTSAVPASQQPAGATGMSEGSDGKMYFHDAAGKQLGLAPDNIQNDDSSTPAQPSSFDFGFTPVSAQSEPQSAGFNFGFQPATAALGDDLSEYGLQASGPQISSGYDPATFEQRHPTITNIGKGLGDTVSDVGNAIKNIPSGIWHSLPPVELVDSTKRALPVINAYEQVRANGGSITDAIKAADVQARQQENIGNTIKKVTDAFKANPTRETARALGDAAALATTIFAGGAAGAGEAGAEGAEGAVGAGEAVSEAPTVAGDLEGSTNAAAPNANTSSVTSSVSDMADAVDNARADTIADNQDALNSPVERTVQKSVAKSGLKTGAPESIAPEGEDIQPSLQIGVRRVISDAAKDAGVDASSAKSIRSVVEETADNVMAKSKAAYRQIDEATGGKFQPNADKLANVNLKLRSILGTDDVAEAKLMDAKAALEAQQEQIFNEAEKNGVPADTVANAKADYKQASALYDLDSQIKMSTSGRAGVGKAPEIVDPNKLSTRLNKLYDSGRLQQAVGEDRASKLIEHADNAQIATQEIKDFVPQSATGKNALANIIRDNTQGKASLIKLGKVQGRTDWNGVVKDFENMSAEERLNAFGPDSANVRKLIGRRAARQNAISAVKKATGYGLGIGAGEEVIRRTINAVTGTGK